MIVIFCSSIYLDEEDTVKKCKVLPNFSSHKLMKNIIKGIDENNVKCHLINIQGLPSFPRSKIINKRTNIWKHNLSQTDCDIDIGFINLPFLKQFIQRIRLTQQLKKYIERNCREDIAVLSYGREYPIVSTINSMKKKYPSIKTCAILGDLTGEYAGEVTNVKSHNPRVILAKRMLDKQMKNVLKFDSLVLVTKNMAEALNWSKPYCVMEGIGNKTDYNEPVDDGDKRVITYAGALEFQYNIKGVIEAFTLIDKENYELWIFGDGPAKEYIINASKFDSRIHYYGVVSPKEISDAYINSTVILNPRQNTGEYTKYTFPSKTMESLLSGRPLIGYKLDGIPSEYYDYMYCVEDNSIQSLKEKILEVCEKNIDERRKISKAAWEYMMSNKTPKKQTKKILQLLKE